MDSFIHLGIPVQMISCTDTDGKITPLRFRFQDKNGEIITITIDTVICRQQDTSKSCTKFTCTANIHGICRTFVLIYNFCLHQWKMTQVNA